MTDAVPDRVRGQWQAFELSGSGQAGSVDLATTAPLLRIGKSASGTAGGRRTLLRDRWWFLIVFLVALSIFGATDVGRIIFDTKLGVDLDAGEFLTRLWSLWDPLAWFGSLQDQYIGYAIPMAPFFAIGQLLHIPVWLIERLWLALLMAVGFTGMVKLARAFRIGSEPSRLLAGTIFVLWPTFTIVIGSTSAAALPGLIVPWAVLPLVSATQGRASTVKAVARSGLAVAAMGGVNAVSTLAVLLLPALYILTHARGRRRIRLGLAWGGAVIAATAWWAIPLLLQGRYSFNFLPYIEQASTTTKTMSAAASLRGTGTWTAYLELGGSPWLPAGWATVTSPLAILASALAAGTGLAGLARRDMPERRWLCICAGLTAAITLSGYYGPLGGPLHATIDSLLDGPLAPFRSTYKFEPVLAVALALGCAHAVERCWRARLQIGRSAHLTGAAITAPVVALALAGLALPQLTGQILQPGSFTAVPSYWNQAAAYLKAHSPEATALVVPADPHGQFTWGDTIDDPLDTLATSPWAERGLVPYGGAGSQVVLQTAEQAVESGQQEPGLPGYLARAGISYVVVRNDVSPDAVGYTPPQAVNETLAESGFRRVAAFGPQVAAAPGYPNLAGMPAGFAASYPSVEIFAAANPHLRVTSPVAALPVSQTALVSGGPDALLQLEGQGVLGGQPTVIAGDPLPATPALWADTDGQPRADNDFGSTSNFLSFTYTATQVNPPDDPLGGGGRAPSQLLPVAAAGHQTVAVLTGAASVTASSAGTWLAELPQYAPANAFDGNPATAWTEASPETPVGQWIQINFGRTVDLPAQVGIQLLDDSPTRSIANQLHVTTAAGGATTDTVDTGNVQQMRVPAGPSRWLRITITGASNVVPGDPGAGISDVLIPGVRVTTYEQAATNASGAKSATQVYSFSQQLPSPYLQSEASGGADLNRIFTTSAESRLSASISALPEPGPALDSLIASLTPDNASDFRVSASSTWDSLPELGPDNLFEPASAKPWLAAATDTQPQLAISWHGIRTISEVVLEPTDGLAAAPTGVLIGSPAGGRLVNVGLGGVVRLSPPLRTDKLYLIFSDVSRSAAGNSAAGQPTQLPTGLAGVRIPGLAGLHVAEPSPTATFRLGCGRGPVISVDGQHYQTSVTGTVADLMQLKAVQLRLCTMGGALTLPAGRQLLSAASSADFSITSLSLASTTDAAAATSPGHPVSPLATSDGGRKLQVLSWQDDNREVRIGPGPQSYVEIHENVNPGWTATLNGRRLAPVTLDGWQQAFIAPAGAGGTIILTYAPASFYHVGIIASAIALLILAALAVGWGWLPRAGSWRRVRDWRPAGRSRQPGPAHLGTGLPRLPALVLRTAAGPDPVRDAADNRIVQVTRGSPESHGKHRRTGAAPGSGVATAPADRLSRSQSATQWLIFVPIAAVIFAVGGPIVIAVPVLALAAWWRTRMLPAIAVAAMLMAGVIAATATTPTTLGSGPFSAPAQVCALIALTAALMPGRDSSLQVRPGGRRSGHVSRISRPVTGQPSELLARWPFSVTDEMVCYFDAAAEPANVHLEMRIPGRLDQPAFCTAAVTAITANHRAASRLAQGGALRRRYVWELPARLDTDPVSFTTFADGAELAQQRIAFLGRSPSVEVAPPVRLLVASGPDADYVILNAHHAAMDGQSCLELLRDIGRRYRGVPAGGTPSEPVSSALTDVSPLPGEPGLPGRRRARRAWPPARIAAERGSERGYGLHMMPLPGVPVVQEFAAGGRATLNEALITSLIAAIGRWNAEHGRPARLIRITVPVNARKANELSSAGNRSRLVTIAALPPRGEGELWPLLLDVARQARQARQQPGPPLGAGFRALAAIWCPAAVKRWVVRAALRTVGPLVCDTVMLTNLGNVADPPDFGAPGDMTMAFSAQAQMPRGMCVAAITAGGRLQVVFRYNRALLDQTAAGRFAEMFATALDEITCTTSGGAT
ncbi:MAG TPA: alpha-(1-_3)-arabinofuranosyltransferase family protein [Streptosporangiaceae bacterium]|nr:alpha-(1->3)-arabinofuranosyltransferase family protein [Streptosporangiaceae bacterium]